MANWRDLVLGSMAEDIGARRASNLSSALPQALQRLRQARQEKKEFGQARELVREKAFAENFPEQAFGISGTVPEGMVPKRTTVGGTVYEAPDILDESGIARVYTDYITRVQSANAANAKFPGYEQIPIPTLVEFTQQYFPEYIDMIRGGQQGVDTTQQGAVQGGKIRVKRKSDGKEGMISPRFFDPNKYERI